MYTSLRANVYVLACRRTRAYARVRACELIWFKCVYAACCGTADVAAVAVADDDTGVIIKTNASYSSHLASSR